MSGTTYQVLVASSLYPPTSPTKHRQDRQDIHQLQLRDGNYSGEMIQKRIEVRMRILSRGEHKTLVQIGQEMRRGLVILSYRGLPLNACGGDEEPRERLRMDFGDGVWTTVELPDMAVCALYLRDLVTRQPHVI